VSGLCDSVVSARLVVDDRTSAGLADDGAAIDVAHLLEGVSGESVGAGWMTLVEVVDAPSVAAPGRTVMTTAGALRFAVIVSHKIDLVQCFGWSARQTAVNASIKMMRLRLGLICAMHMQIGVLRS
jgi:hypothetical protein